MSFVDIHALLGDQILTWITGFTTKLHFNLYGLFWLFCLLQIMDFFS